MMGPDAKVGINGKYYEDTRPLQGGCDPNLKIPKLVKILHIYKNSVRSQVESLLISWIRPSDYMSP